MLIETLTMPSPVQKNQNDGLFGGIENRRFREKPSRKKDEMAVNPEATTKKHEDEQAKNLATIRIDFESR